MTNFRVGKELMLIHLVKQTETPRDATVKCIFTSLAAAAYLDHESASSNYTSITRP